MAPLPSPDTATAEPPLELACPLSAVEQWLAGGEHRGVTRLKDVGFLADVGEQLFQRERDLTGQAGARLVRAQPEAVERDAGEMALRPLREDGHLRDEMARTERQPEPAFSEDRTQNSGT